MEDKRIGMCKEIIMLGQLRGDFFPCIGSGNYTNYVYRGVIVSLSLTNLIDLHKVVVDRYDAMRKHDECVEALITDKFRERNKTNERYENPLALLEEEAAVAEPENAEESS